MKTKRRQHFLSLVLMLCMALTMIPVSVFAVSPACPHGHENCGYQAAVEEHPCSVEVAHIHDGTCGYVAAKAAVPCTIKCDICGTTDAVAMLGMSVQPLADLAIEPEAKIGETTYLTVDAAFAAVKNNDTITLLKNCEMTAKPSLTKSFTLDFNGFTMETTLSAIDIDAAVITFMDSSNSSGTLIRKAPQNISASVFQLKNNAGVIWNSGTFNSDSNNFEIASGDITVNGGSIICTKANSGSVIANSSGRNSTGTVTLNGGIVTSNNTSGTFGADGTIYAGYGNIRNRATEIVNTEIIYI